MVEVSQDLIEKNPTVVHAGSSDAEVLQKLKTAETTALTQQDAKDYLEFMPEPMAIISGMKALADDSNSKVLEIKTPRFFNSRGNMDAEYAQFREDGEKRISSFLKKMKQEGVIENSYFYVGDAARSKYGNTDSFFGDRSILYITEDDWNRIKQHEISLDRGDLAKKFNIGGSPSGMSKK